jgi:hypothetical protein
VDSGTSAVSASLPDSKSAAKRCPGNQGEHDPDNDKSGGCRPSKPVTVLAAHTQNALPLTGAFFYRRFGTLAEGFNRLVEAPLLPIAKLLDAFRSFRNQTKGVGHEIGVIGEALRDRLQSRRLGWQRVLDLVGWLYRHRAVD